MFEKNNCSKDVVLVSQEMLMFCSSTEICLKLELMACKHLHGQGLQSALETQYRYSSTNKSIEEGGVTERGKECCIALFDSLCFLGGDGLSSMLLLV